VESRARSADRSFSRYYPHDHRAKHHTGHAEQAFRVPSELYQLRVPDRYRASADQVAAMRGFATDAQALFADSE